MHSIKKQDKNDYDVYFKKLPSYFHNCTSRNALAYTQEKSLRTIDNISADQKNNFSSFGNKA